MAKEQPAQAHDHGRAPANSFLEGAATVANQIVPDVCAAIARRPFGDLPRALDRFSATRSCASPAGAAISSIAWR
jgi:hypothetical protein